MQPQDKDLESLNKFWHWADNERPDRDLFDTKAIAGGPLTEEAQEAMQQAVEVVSLRAPDCLHPSGEALRPAIKAVSFAIMYAWKLMRENPMIQDALLQQAKRDDFNDSVRDVFGPFIVPGPPNDASKSNLTPISGCLDAFCGEDITITYPDGTKRYGSLSKGGNGVYDFNEYTGKAKDIIAKKRAAASKDPADHIQDAAGYTAYNMQLPGEYRERIEEGMRKEAQIKGLSHHYSGQTVDLKSVTIIPVIGEMGVGVTRTAEHDSFKQRLHDMMGPNDLEHLVVRVDSRGILFQSTEFTDIEMLCGFDEFETCAGNGSIDAHKLFLIVNTMRHNVIKRKQEQHRVF